MTFASRPLCQNIAEEAKMIPSVRIELTTLGLLDPRSNQLSYEGESVEGWLSQYKNAVLFQLAIAFAIAAALPWLPFGAILPGNHTTYY